MQLSDFPSLSFTHVYTLLTYFRCNGCDNIRVCALLPSTHTGVGSDYDFRHCCVCGHISDFHLSVLRVSGVPGYSVSIANSVGHLVSNNFTIRFLRDSPLQDHRDEFGPAVRLNTGPGATGGKLYNTTSE